MVQIVGWYPVFFFARYRFRVVDVRSSEDGALITLQESHRVPHGRVVTARLVDTGDPDLNKVQGWVIFTTVDEYRVQLAQVKVAESSEGIFLMRSPEEFFRIKTGMHVNPITQALVAVVFAVGLTWFEQLWLPARDNAIYSSGIHFLGIVFALMVAGLRRWRHAQNPTRLQARIEDFREKLLAANPRPQPSERGPHRAVTAADIQSLYDYFGDFIADRNAYYLDANITRPLTQPFRLSISELIGPRIVTFFVSHWWGTPFQTFVRAIRQHAEYVTDRVSSSPTSVGDSWETVSYWICFLSNNQWELLDEMGHGDWHNSSFFLTLESHKCRATCMVLDGQAMPLKRSWCLFEVLQTYKLQEASGKHADDVFEGLVFLTREGIIGRHDTFDTALALASKLSTLSVQDATATDENDQRMIISLVEKEEARTGVSMDKFIKGNMRATLEMAKERFDEKAAMLADVLGGESRDELDEQADSSDNRKAGRKFVDI